MKLTKAQQAVVDAMKDGTPITRFKTNGKYGPYLLGKTPLQVKTVRAIEHLLDYDSRVEAAGYVKRQIFTLKAEYRKGSGSA